MDQGPLVTERIDAGAWLIREFGRKIPVQAAFWLKEREDDWYLYLASDQINDANFDQAYAEVIRVAGSQENLWLDPFQVKVVGLDTPVAQAAVAEIKNRPGRLPARYHGRQFGGLSVDEVLIYRLPVPVSA